jgi:hypothetical protein
MKDIIIMGTILYLINHLHCFGQIMTVSLLFEQLGCSSPRSIEGMKWFLADCTKIKAWYRVPAKLSKFIMDS